METLKLSLGVIFHPVDTFTLIKSRKIKLNYALGFLFLALVIFVRLAQIFITSYQLTGLEPKNANILLEILRFAVPILTWAVAAFAVTSILDGEAFVPEIFIAAAYCMTPYILLNIPVAMLSKLLGQSEAGFYKALGTLVWVWVFLLFFQSLKVLNNYSLQKAFLCCILILVFMLLIWALCILFIAFTGQLYMVIKEVIYEIRMLVMD